MRKYCLVCVIGVYLQNISTLQTLQFSRWGMGKGLYSTTMILVCTSTQTPLVMSINWKQEFIIALLDINHFLLTLNMHYAFIEIKGILARFINVIGFLTVRELNMRGTKGLQSPWHRRLEISLLMPLTEPCGNKACSGNQQLSAVTTASFCCVLRVMYRDKAPL